MKYDFSDDKNTRVSECSDWIEISALKDNFKGKMGVFLLADDENEVLYISQLDKMFGVLEGAKSMDCTRVKILFTDTLRDKFSLLFYLLKKYNPVNNFRSKVEYF